MYKNRVLLKKEILKYYKILILKGLYFEAHEYLENYWKSLKKYSKSYYLFKIFIQLAALLHKIRNQKNYNGARKIIKNIINNISKFIDDIFSKGYQ
jgi:predicted metal-dependent hydrolase